MRFWWQGRSDLAFDQDNSSRMLPFIIAFLVYMAALALGGSLALNGAIDRWTAGLAGTLTVQVADTTDRPSTPAQREARVAKALAVLRATPGVGSAEPIDDGEVARLLEPWLGQSALTAELPLPRLIDVTITDRGALDLDALKRQLADQVPEAALDDHGLWREQLAGLARSVEWVTLVIVGLIAAAAVAVVVFATRSGLMVHHDTIEVLHLIGARDSYVARQFQNRAISVALQGSLSGLGLAALTLFGLAIAGDGVDDALLPRLELGWGDWAVLALLPVITALIAMGTARFTVTTVLARLP